MNEYARPSVPERVYRDQSGAVIEYGYRWPGSIPSDSYSRTSNLDRFAPLHAVADALIEHLISTYDITATSVEMDDTNRNCSTIKALELSAAAQNTPQLLIRFTDYPSVEVKAGLTHDVIYPDCSCDACDETWESCAEDLEDLVFAVAAGGFDEQIELPPRWKIVGRKATVGFRIMDTEGHLVRASARTTVPTDALTATAARLDARPDGRWLAWPLSRTGDARE